MNRLKGQITYLSSPMEHAPDGGVIWRKLVTPKFHSMSIGVIDPCDKPFLSVLNEDKSMREEVAILKREGKFQEVRKIYKKIVSEDLRSTDLAMFLTVNLNMKHKPIGTLDEVFMASNQRKPVLLVCEDGKENIPNWLFGRLNPDLFFSSFDEMFTFLRRVDSGEITPKGWLFFDYKKIFGFANERNIA